MRYVIRRARVAGRRVHGTFLERLPLEALPERWVVAPPDFVGIGAQKCGTRWWYQAVCAHPRVYRLPGAPKERHYFNRFSKATFTARSAARYRRLFPRPSGSLSGEWTPRYMHDVWTPALLARAAPDARLLVLLRDPVERFRSGIAFNTKNLGVEVVADTFTRGLYHTQLDRVLEHFDRERVLILQLELCRDRPDEQLRRTFAFLGLEDSLPTELLRRKVNVTTAPKPLLDPPLLEDLRAAYRDDAMRLFQAFPELDPALWTTLAL